jgi:hypothetical protein
MGGACNTHGKVEKCIKYLVGKPEWKRPIGKPRRRWEDSVTIKIGWKIVDWIHLAQDGKL